MGVAGEPVVDAWKGYRPGGYAGANSVNPTPTPSGRVALPDKRSSWKGGGGLDLLAAKAAANIITFNGEEMVKATRCFFTEHPEVARRTAKECEDIRFRLSLHVTCDQLTDIPRPTQTLEEVPFPDPFIQVITRQGITQPSPIQVQAWPTALWGYDIIGVAETGSGKTLAYVVPMLVHIQAQPELKANEGPIGLVLVPHRELCQQVLNTIDLFQNETHLTAVALTGGEEERLQVNKLLGRVDIAVACPGRLISLLAENKTNLKRTTFVVFDEADDLFSDSFAVQVRALMSQVRSDRQVLLFSATWPEKVEIIAEEYCRRKPCTIIAGSTKLAACKDITQMVMLVRHKASLPEGWEDFSKLEVLHGLLAKVNGQKVLVFCNSKEKVTEVVQGLLDKGIKCEGFSSVSCNPGDSTSSKVETRQERLNRFCDPNSDLSILVATQVLGRGYDFKNVQYVINYDMPHRLVEYVHRIGRTGRGGQKGFSMTLMEEDDLWAAKELKEVLEATNQRVDKWLANAAKSSRSRAKIRKAARAAAEGDGAPPTDDRGTPQWNGRGSGSGRDAALRQLSDTGLGKIRGYKP